MTTQTNTSPNACTTSWCACHNAEQESRVQVIEHGREVTFGRWTTMVTEGTTNPTWQPGVLPPQIEDALTGGDLVDVLASILKATRILGPTYLSMAVSRAFPELSPAVLAEVSGADPSETTATPEAYFSRVAESVRAALTRAGRSESALSDILGADLPTARLLWSGWTPYTLDELVTIADAIKMDVRELAVTTTPTETDAETGTLR